MTFNNQHSFNVGLGKQIYKKYNILLNLVFVEVTSSTRERFHQRGLSSLSFGKY